MNIEELLLEKYNRVADKYTEDRILGIFLVGKVDWNLYNDLKEDAEFVAIYLPPFEELCVSFEKKDTLFADEKINLMDYRKFNAHLIKCEREGLEVLFSKHYLLNERYKDLYERKLLNNREIISKINPGHYVKHSTEIALENTYTDFISFKILTEIDLYTKGSCEESFHPTSGYTRVYLKDAMLRSDFFLDQDNFKEMERLRKVSNYMPKNKNGIVYVIKAATAIMNEAHRDIYKSEPTLPALTKTEKRAFEEIKKRAENNEATISISKIAEETGISRPVWKNLFQKLELGNAAKITNMGVNGTRIKFINDIEDLKV